MQPLGSAGREQLAPIQHVLCDLDDTLTYEGRLPAAAYSKLEQLADAGFGVVIVTGRPAGWCDLIARLWPVAGVIGENGAFYFAYDQAARQMHRRYWQTAHERARNIERLRDLFDGLSEDYPGLTTAGDQAYRESDLTIDICEDVSPLPSQTVAELITRIEAAGAAVRESSIHLNFWFGDFDKLAMTQRFFAEQLRLDSSSALQKAAIFVGDSPNDEPMFAFFPLSVGVANIKTFASRMTHLPRWTTTDPGGHGFCELADKILSSR